jgi:hypothetical protein
MTTMPPLELLECVVAKAPIGIPRTAVAQLIAYQLAPIPAPAPYIGGLGLYAGNVVISIALTPALGIGVRTTRGVLLQAPAGAGQWCIEVTQVGGFVAATPVDDDGTADSATRPRWLRRAQLASGRTVTALDVDAMVADLARGGGR